MNCLVRFIVILLFSCFHSTNADCRPGEYTLGSRCFRFVSVPKTFDEAEAYCQSVGYHLASIHNIFENNFLQQTAQKEFELPDSYFRIGLNTSDRITWNWTDKSPFNYWYWSPGEPTGNDLCAAIIIADGKWTTYPCSNAEPFACAGNSGGTGTTEYHTQPQVSTSPPQKASTNWWWSTLFPPFTLAPSQPSTQAHPTLNPVSTRNPNSYTTAYPTNANCSQGWGYYAFTKKCYYFKQYNPYIYDPQLNNCHGSVHFDDENYFVKNLAENFFATSTNCFDKATSPNLLFIVGNITYDFHSVYHWSDTTPFDYSPNSVGPLPEHWYFIYASVDYASEKVTWAATSNEKPYAAESYCYYYLCEEYIG